MNVKQIKDYIFYYWDADKVTIDEQFPGSGTHSFYDVAIKFKNFNVKVELAGIWSYKQWTSCIDEAIKRHAYKAFEKQEVMPKMYPVCDCGHVLKGLSINNNPGEVNDFLSDAVMLKIDSHIDPSHCPNCGKRITAVMYKEWVDGRLEYSYD